MDQLSDPISRNMYKWPGMKLSLDLLGMHCNRVERDWSFPIQKHMSIELNAVIQGQQILESGGQLYVMNEGDIAIIRPGLEHSCRAGSCSSLTYFCVHLTISDSEVRTILLRNRSIVLTCNTPEYSSIHDLIRQLASCVAERPSSSGIRIHVFSLILQLLLYITDAIRNKSKFPLTTDIHTNLTPLAKDIAARIEQLVVCYANIDVQSQAYRIQDVAAQLGVSMSHCNRVFKLVYNMTPRQYLSLIKLNEAKRMLLSQDLTIERIARMLQYADAAHFSRQFKRWTGQSPNTYRQQNI